MKYTQSYWQDALHCCQSRAGFHVLFDSPVPIAQAILRQYSVSASCCAPPKTSTCATSAPSRTWSPSCSATVTLWRLECALAVTLVQVKCMVQSPQPMLPQRSKPHTSTAPAQPPCMGCLPPHCKAQLTCMVALPCPRA